MRETHETKLKVTMQHGRVLHVHAGQRTRLETQSPWLYEVVDYGPPRPCLCCRWLKPEPVKMEIKPDDISVLEEVWGCWLSDEELDRLEELDHLDWLAKRRELDS